jgi:hypothetical protein
MRGTRRLLLAIALSSLLVACRGGEESDSRGVSPATSTATATSAATLTPTPPGSTSATPVATSSPPPAVVTITPGTPTATPPTSPSGTATPTPASNTRTVLAPVVDASIAILQSQPPSYVLRVTTALPDGCNRFKDARAQRDGTQIIVTVENEVPANATACTQIYGTKETTIALGRDFTRGTTYTVVINGERTLTFVGQ